MKRQIFITLLLIVNFLGGCQDFIFNRNIVGRYHLIATDSKAEMSLSYKLDDGNYIGIINGGIYALGNNSYYIIVKQHPYTPFPDSLNKQITNYFIIPIDKDISQYKVEENFIGPLNETEFVNQKEKLKIPKELAFNLVIKENE